MTVKRLVVSGGNGFLGLAVCRGAVARGWKVTSLSRSGSPHWDNGIMPSWAEQVRWLQADVFKQDTYKDAIEECDSIIHTIGILLEFNYKKLFSGRTPVRDLLSRGVMNVFAPNPLANEANLKYTRYNVDSAVAVARAAAECQRPKSFIYISAADTFPGLPSGYIQSKRHAEAHLEQFDKLRTIFLRPSFMYSSERPSSERIAQLLLNLAGLNSVSGNSLSRLLKGAVIPPLPITTVAEAALECVSKSDLRGPVLPDQIAQLFHNRALY